MPRPSSATRRHRRPRSDHPGAHTRGAPVARAGSRDELGPQGAEAVGGRGLPSPAGHSSLLRLALLTPGGGSRDPGEEDGKEEGMSAAAATTNPHDRHQLRPNPDKRDTSRRALPLSTHVTSGSPEAGPMLAPPRDRFAPPHGRLTSVDFWVPVLKEPQFQACPVSSTCAGPVRG